MKEFIDIGINLMHRSFGPDREIVIKEGQEAGVSALIITGTSVRSSEEAARYAEGMPGILYSTAGVHPHDAKSCDEKTIPRLRALLKKPQVVAVGECGLDYDRDFSPRPVQRKWFEAQLQLADEEKMPLFLHERAAFADFFALMKERPALCERAVVHCFTGNQKELEAYLSLGCFIGITGWICDERRGKDLQKIVKLIPRDKILVETDAPFLTPRDLPQRPYEGRNAPEYLPHIVKAIARHRGESLEELADAALQNTKKLFSIS